MAIVLVVMVYNVSALYGLFEFHAQSYNIFYQYAVVYIPKCLKDYLKIK